MRKMPINLHQLCIGVFCIILLIYPLLSCRTISRSAKYINLPHNTVILSFDDGPNMHEDTTARLLDILRKYNIQAIFSLLGVNAENNPDLVRRIHEDGHTIVNHGYSDKWAVWMKKNEFKDNLLKTENAVNSALGNENRPRLYRPHGGFYHSKQQKIWRAEGFTFVACNARTYDAVLTKSEQDKVIRKIIKKVEKQGSGIILLHDARDSHIRMESRLKKQPDGSYNRSWIPEAVEAIIVSLLENGYQFGKPGY